MIRLNEDQRKYQEAMTWLLDDGQRRSGRSFLCVVMAIRLSILRRQPVLIVDHGTASGTWWLRDLVALIAQEYGLEVALRNFRISVDLDHNPQGIVAFLEHTAPDYCPPETAEPLKISLSPSKSLVKILEEDF